MPPTSDSATREALKAITAKNQINSPLLRLPAEIRNQIYGYVLGNDDIRICANFRCDVDTARSVPVSLSTLRLKAHVHYPKHRLYLLEACQQTYSEARLLVFELNKLTGGDLDVNGFLSGSKLTLDQKSALASLELGLHVHMRDGYLDGNAIKSSEQRLRSLARLPGLEKMVLCCLLYSHSGEETAKAASMLKARLEDAVGRKIKTVIVEVIPVQDGD